MHQFTHGFRAKGKLQTGCLEQGRERLTGAECQALLVVAERIAWVPLCPHPHLQCAELRDAVFDVVEGQAEDMQLAVPHGLQRVLMTRPVDGGSKAVIEVQPVLLAIFARVRGVQIDPVLERIDGCDPREHGAERLKVIASGAHCVV